MRDRTWDRFVIYVNAFYAIQEAYDSARRAWVQPAAGLEAFCRDANPFLWDEEGSAEEAVYAGFCEEFQKRFGKQSCTASDGLAFVRDWLASQEGDAYGHDLMTSLDQVSDPDAWEEACEPIADQLRMRAVRIERTPQDESVPDDYVLPAPHTPSPADVEAVIAMLAKGDEAFAQSLRERLA